MAMFLLQQIQHCGPGRQAEAVKRLHWIHAQMAEHPFCECFQIVDEFVH